MRAVVEGSVIGYVIVEWNQASGRPSVLDFTGTDTLGDARRELATERRRAAGLGRKETYAIGTVVLDEDTSERES
jgi:hypothetical protein